MIAALLRSLGLMPDRRSKKRASLSQRERAAFHDIERAAADLEDESDHTVLTFGKGSPCAPAPTPKLKARAG